METNRENTDAEGIDADAVKALVNRWGREGFFRIKGWGHALTAITTRPLPFYVLSLETQYEHRTVAERKVPDEGGQIDDVGTPLDLWEVELPPPASFENRRVEGGAIPHTETLVACEPCRGIGRVDCLPCRGTGRVNRGTRTERGCPQCAGRGWIEHAECGGKGRFRQYRAVVSEFTSKTLKERMFSVPLPEALLAEAGKETVSEQFRKGGGFVPSGHAPEMEPALEELWRQSVPDDPATTRILFQRFRIERVKGFEVHCESPASTTPQTFWIVGEQKRVYGLQAPRAWGRILGVGVPAGAVAGLLLFLLISSLASQFRASSSTLAAQDGSGITPIAVSDRSPHRTGVKKAPSKDAKQKTASNAEIPLTEGGISEDDSSAESEKGRSGRASAAASSENAEETPEEPDDAGENAAGDSANGANAPDLSPNATFDVLVGIFSDSDSAQDAASKTEEAAYTPTTTTTQDPNDRLYIVSVKGFWTREDAEKAAADLKEKGLSAQVQASGSPAPASTASTTASASTGGATTGADASPATDPAPAPEPSDNPPSNTSPDASP